jgi:hypothetical protein
LRSRCGRAAWESMTTRRRLPCGTPRWGPALAGGGAARRGRARTAADAPAGGGVAGRGAARRDAACSSRCGCAVPHRHPSTGADHRDAAPARRPAVARGGAATGAVRPHSVSRGTVPRLRAIAAVGAVAARTAVGGPVRRVDRRGHERLRVDRSRSGCLLGHRAGPLLGGRGRPGAGEGPGGRGLVDRVATQGDAGLRQAAGDLVGVQPALAGDVSDASLCHSAIHGSNRGSAAGRQPDPTSGQSKRSASPGGTATEARNVRPKARRARARSRHAPRRQV